jgi:hypothetical protein
MRRARLPEPRTRGDLAAELNHLPDAELLRLCLKHNIRDDVSLTSLTDEAARRGIDVHTVVRERIVWLLKRAGLI